MKKNKKRSATELMLHAMKATQPRFVAPSKVISDKRRRCEQKELRRELRQIREY